MKLVILAGGYGTRISEETERIPKPMIEIGNRPLIWHLIKYYSNFGIEEFIICCGYRGYVIKEYFMNYFTHMSDLTIDLSDGITTVHREYSEPWKVTLVDTGDSTQTGGRLKRVAEYLGDETFCFTYGDGLSDIDIRKEIDFHKQHKKLATIAAVKPPGRYGALEIDNGRVTDFVEKPPGDGGLINGGYFVLEPRCLEMIEGDDDSWESGPLNKLAESGNLMAFEHEGFWQPMDTLREKNLLEEMWTSGSAPWKIW
tara:strand:- start:785 stop:1552 length:768 start_codon:yes stop_codon:yes gene_type:complete